MVVVRVYTSKMAMLSDWELWSCANQQIARHGTNAEFEAALRADSLLSTGDLAGQRIWIAILERIIQLNGTAVDETKH